MKKIIALITIALTVFTFNSCGQDDNSVGNVEQHQYKYTVKTEITQIYKNGKSEISVKILDNVFQTDIVDTAITTSFVTGDSIKDGYTFYRTKMDYYVTYNNNNLPIDYLWEVRDPDPAFADDIFIQENQSTGSDERHTWMIAPYDPFKFNHNYTIDISIHTVQ